MMDELFNRIPPVQITKAGKVVLGAPVLQRQQEVTREVVSIHTVLVHRVQPCEAPWGFFRPQGGGPGRVLSSTAHSPCNGCNFRKDLPNSPTNRWTRHVQVLVNLDVDRRDDLLLAPQEGLGQGGMGTAEDVKENRA